MKNILITSIIIFSIFFISGCTKSEAISNKECVDKGFVFKNKKVLNYRTGKYEFRNVCIKDK